MTLALWALSACARGHADPEETLRAFLNDLRTGRAEAAWAAVSTNSQKELERRRAAIAGESDGKAASPAKILFEDLGLMSISQPESIAVSSPPGDQVTLRVSVKDGRSASIRMVREGESWKIDLVGSLRPAPPLADQLGREELTDTATVP